MSKGVKSIKEVGNLNDLRVAKHRKESEIWLGNVLKFTYTFAHKFVQFGNAVGLIVILNVSIQRNIIRPQLSTTLFVSLALSHRASRAAI